MALRKFTTSELKLSNYEAYKVLSLFFGHVKISAKEITDNDRAFAQALLYEGLCRSNGIMSIVNNDQIVEKFFKEMPSSMGFAKDIVKSFMRKAGGFVWKESLTGARNSLYGDSFYSPVVKDARTALATEYRNAWNNRVATGKPVIY